MKTLKEIIARLAEIDTEIRAATTNEDLDKIEKEKTELLERKAELEALEKRKQTALDIANGAVKGSVVDKRVNIGGKITFDGMSTEEVRATDEYRSAWLKSIRGLPLEEVEQRSISAVDVAGIIPTQTKDQITSLMEEYAPILSEIDLTRINGNVTVGYETASSDAEIHTENAEMTPGTDTIDTITLTSYELAKFQRISKTVTTMAIADFERWLSDKMAEKLAKLISFYSFYGTGSSQPQGVDYSRTWVDGTNAVAWAGTSPTYAELCELIGYLKGGYHGNAKFALNRQTFWQHIQAIRDDSKAKIVNDAGDRILGYPILFDDTLASGDIFFGNYKKINGNLSQDISIERSTESGFKYGAIDFRGMCMFDCKCPVGESFVKTAKTLTAGK